MEKSFRGKKLNIKVNNPDGHESGCKKLTVNGTAMEPQPSPQGEGSPLEGNYIPASILKPENEIILDM